MLCHTEALCALVTLGAPVGPFIHLNYLNYLNHFNQLSFLLHWLQSISIGINPKVEQQKSKDRAVREIKMLIIKSES